MASPQEVLEIAIPHLPDVTPEIRRTVAKHVIEALQANDYYFVQRQLPVREEDDGECPQCKCRLVHVLHRPAFANAEERIEWERRRANKMETALQRLAALSADTNPTMDTVRQIARGAVS